MNHLPPEVVGKCVSCKCSLIGKEEHDHADYDFATICQIESYMDFLVCMFAAFSEAKIICLKNIHVFVYSRYQSEEKKGLVNKYKNQNIINFAPSQSWNISKCKHETIFKRWLISHRSDIRRCGSNFIKFRKYLPAIFEGSICIKTTKKHSLWYDPHSLVFLFTEPLYTNI